MNAISSNLNDSIWFGCEQEGWSRLGICLPKMCANKSSPGSSIRTLTPLTQLEPHYSRSRGKHLSWCVCVCAQNVASYLSLCNIAHAISVWCVGGVWCRRESKLYYVDAMMCRCQNAARCAYVWAWLLEIWPGWRCWRSLSRFIERDAAWRQFQQEIAE